MIFLIGDTIVVRVNDSEATYRGATIENLQDAARLLSRWTKSQ